MHIEPNSFPLDIDFEGDHLTGVVEPSLEKDEKGRPVHFRVLVNGELFAYLCCGVDGWKDNQKDKDHKHSLINTIGDYISDWYE